MSSSERGEILSDLLKMQADAGILFLKCKTACALEIGVSVQAVKTILDEVVNDLSVPCEQPETRPWAGKY